MTSSDAGKQGAPRRWLRWVGLFALVAVLGLVLLDLFWLADFLARESLGADPTSFEVKRDEELVLTGGEDERILYDGRRDEGSRLHARFVGSTLVSDPYVTRYLTGGLDPEPDHDEILFWMSSPEQVAPDAQGCWTVVTLDPDASGDVLPRWTVRPGEEAGLVVTAEREMLRFRLEVRPPRFDAGAPGPVDLRSAPFCRIRLFDHDRWGHVPVPVSFAVETRAGGSAELTVEGLPAAEEGAELSPEGLGLFRLGSFQSVVVRKSESGERLMRAWRTGPAGVEVRASSREGGGLWLRLTGNGRLVRELVLEGDDRTRYAFLRAWVTRHWLVLGLLAVVVALLYWLKDFMVELLTAPIRKWVETKMTPSSETLDGAAEPKPRGTDPSR